MATRDFLAATTAGIVSLAAADAVVGSKVTIMGPRCGKLAPIAVYLEKSAKVSAVDALLDNTIFRDIQLSGKMSDLPVYLSRSLMQVSFTELLNACVDKAVTLTQNEPSLCKLGICSTKPAPSRDAKQILKDVATETLQECACDFAFDFCRRRSAFVHTQPSVSCIPTFADDCIAGCIAGVVREFVSVKLGSASKADYIAAGLREAVFRALFIRTMAMALCD